MPENDASYSSRAVGVLFAIGVLIVLAGLAGLGATVLSVTSSAGKGASADSEGRITIPNSR